MNGSGTYRKQSDGFLFFVLLLAACTAARIILALFSETGTLCQEEILNLELAQSIRFSGRFTVYGTQTGFSSILYPVLLAPFFGIGDSDTRLKAISVFNALLVSSALIPAWLLNRKLLIKEGSGKTVLVLFAVSANLWFSETFMAECLYIPLALWGIWFLLCVSEKGMPGFGTACGLGVWTYLVFLSAPAGVSMTAGAFMLLVYTAVREKDGKKAVAGCLGFVTAFAAAYATVMVICFGGKLYYYPELLGGKIAAPQQLLFWLYAGLCALLWFAAAVLFIPALVPVALYRQQDDLHRKLTVFLMAFIVAAAYMTAYAFSVEDDFSRMDIRIVQRFFIPAAWLLIPLFISVPENIEQTGKKHPLVRMAACMAILVILFLQIPRAEIVLDAPVLQALAKMSGGRLPVIAVRAAAVLLLAAGTILWLKGKRKFVAGVFLTALIAVNAANGALTFLRIRQEKRNVAPELKNEAKILGNYLDSLDGTILFIAADPGGNAQRLADLYNDTDHRLIGTETLRLLAVEAEEPGIIRTGGDLSSGALQQADYIVCHEGENVLLGGQYRNCTPDGVTFMKVYSNGEPERLDVRGLFALHPGEQMSFTKEKPDLLGYPVSGFSNPENGFTWTEGQEATVMLLPVSDGKAGLDLVWTRKMTSGEQTCRIYADEELLYDGSVEGEGELRIRIPDEITETNEPVTFRFVLPDARQPENGDQRFLAVAFVSLSLEER